MQYKPNGIDMVQNSQFNISETYCINELTWSFNTWINGNNLYFQMKEKAFLKHSADHSRGKG